MAPLILIIDDEELLRWSLKERLLAADYEVIEAASRRESLERLSSPVDLIVLDMKLPDADGRDLLRELKASQPDTPIIVMTAHCSIESGVQSMKDGAFHYLSKPFELEQLVLLVAQALETTSLRREMRVILSRQSEGYGFELMLGESTPLREVKELLQRVAQSSATTVLLTGESGTGKDLAARALHNASARKGQPFMNITCSALADNLLESELFGHERGAFTDAKFQRKGLLEQADGGTVYLDEIGEMAVGLQSKLLRFLEERSVRRVGGVADIEIDVRVIAATNRDLDVAIKDGSFRSDLYYRLAVVPIVMPPLRARRDDVPLLVHAYVDRFNRQFRKSVKSVDADALELLQAYAWPGNVRELRNVVERAMLLAEKDSLSVSSFELAVPISHRAPRSRDDLTGLLLPAGGIDLAQLERELVIQALERTRGNRTQAAALLGMNRDQMRYRIEKFGLEQIGASTPS